MLFLKNRNLPLNEELGGHNNNNKSFSWHECSHVNCHFYLWVELHFGVEIMLFLHLTGLLNSSFWGIDERWESFLTIQLNLWNKQACLLARETVQNKFNSLSLIQSSCMKPFFLPNNLSWKHITSFAHV